MGDLCDSDADNDGIPDEEVKKVLLYVFLISACFKLKITSNYTGQLQARQ